MTDLRIAGSGHDNVFVHVLRRIYPNDMDYWDGNWLVTEVEGRVGGWYSRYPASLRVEEFIDFRGGRGGTSPPREELSSKFRPS